MAGNRLRPHIELGASIGWHVANHGTRGSTPTARGESTARADPRRTGVGPASLRDRGPGRAYPGGVQACAGHHRDSIGVIDRPVRTVRYRGRRPASRGNHPPPLARGRSRRLAEGVHAVRTLGEKRPGRETGALIRLHILVEVQTEETFVNNVLGPALAEQNVFVDAHRITTGRKRGRTFRGGLLIVAARRPRP